MKPAIARALRWLLVAILALVSLVAFWQAAVARLGTRGAAVPEATLALCFLSFVVAHAARRVRPVSCVVGAMALGLVVRVIWIVSIDNKLVSDFAIYHELAVALVTGQGYTLTGPAGVEDVRLYLGPGVTLPYVTAYRAPGTSLWGAFLYSLAGTRPVVFEIANVALDVVLIGLIASLALRSRLSAGATALAALLWAVYPSAIFATGLFGSETLFAFLLLLIAWSFSRSDAATGRGQLGMAAFIGSAAAGALLVRSMSLSLVSAILFTILLADGDRRRVARAGMALCFLVVGLLPWAYRNWTVFHRFVPICTSEGEFLGRHTMTFVPEHLKDEVWRSRYDAWRALTHEVDRAREGYAISTDHLKRMLRGGPAHVVRCLVLAVRSSFSHDLDLLFWSTRRSFRSVVERGPRSAVSKQVFERLSVVTNAMYLAILVGALAGALLLEPTDLLESSGLAFLVFFFLTAFAALASVVGQHRYHFGLMPFLVLLCAHGYGALASRWMKDDASPEPLGAP